MNTESTRSARLPIRTKLMLNFGLLFALVMGAMGVTWLTLNQIQTQAERIIERYEPQVSRVSQVELLMIRISLEARHAMLSADNPADLEATLQRIGDFRRQKLELLAEIDADITTREGKEILSKIRQSDELFWKLAEDTVGLILAGNVAGAFNLLKSDLVDARNVQLQHIDEQKVWQRQLMSQALETASRTAVRVKMGLAIVVTAVLIAISFAIFSLMKMMEGAFARAQSVTTRIAGGELDTNVYVRKGDEFGELFSSIVEMKDRLNNVVNRVREASTHIVEAASSLDQTNQLLKSSAEEQQQAIERSVTGTHQMVEAVSLSASATEEVNRLVTQASEVARQGGQAVGQVVSEMQQIRNASGKISEIVGVIDGIAFQTNILALNAAVEAARAGEQGRGFAVVAAEVRNLAQRSAQAAKEVKALISNSTERVSSGATAAGHAGDTMQSLLQAVDQLSQRMEDIAQATQRQRETVSVMEASMSAVSERAVSNAELVGRSYSTAAALRSEAHTLDEAISAFNLEVFKDPDAHSANLPTLRLGHT
jgi:methyl-accepting chemotaxis protein